MLSAEQARLLKKNWKDIGASSVANPMMFVVAQFYRRLLRKKGYKRIFEGIDIETQYFKMQGALTACVEFAENLDKFADTIRRIGARHARYNMTPNMMNDVVDSLVPSLKEFSLDHGITWNEEIEEAYDEWLEQVTGYFMEGIMNAPPPPPVAAAAGPKVVEVKENGSGQPKVVATAH
ncbi:hypothetical protein M427DRAFT_73171 [Gonapodya prolifera JEL478]|uniref:Globin-like protein n=1 Tax=Gonapodya prolifera (strain JEL478) TaxID=1344416 RepID=A0A139A347_GONPJ|nr:hypothetical protein M427DRAFT_73171 [Gonapodya prolifera JEL478]|eukprot:KXS11212.1 hypothetical protein M427DRAFT_73171 [Gonapodya prolifera JEL478]